MAAALAGQQRPAMPNKLIKIILLLLPELLPDERWARGMVRRIVDILMMTLEGVGL